MSSLLAKTVAGLVFLFGEYSIIAMAVFPVNAIWSFWQLLLLAPAALAAVWVFRPLVRRDPDPQIVARLLAAGVSLVFFGFLVVALAEVVYRASYSKH